MNPYPKEMQIMSLDTFCPAPQRRRSRAAFAALAVLGLASAGAARAQKIVGMPIESEARYAKAFAKQVDCQGSQTHRHDGTIKSQPFKLLAMSCPFVGGNAEWSAIMVGLHDGKRFTRVLGFTGGLSVQGGLAVQGDRIVYQALVAKASDARCCPTGRAVVEIDMSKAVAVARTLGFKAPIAPVPAKTLK